MDRRHSSKKSGQSLVEFAFIVLPFMMIVFGIIEFGTLFSIYVGLTNTAREAARAGAIYRFDVSPTATPTLGSVDGEREAVMDQVVADRLHPLIDDGDLDSSYTYDPPRTDQLATSGAYSYRYGEKVIVTLSYTHNLFFNFMGQTITLQAESEMKLEPGGR